MAGSQDSQTGTEVQEAQGVQEAVVMADFQEGTEDREVNVAWEAQEAVTTVDLRDVTVDPRDPGASSQTPSALS